MRKTFKSYAVPVTSRNLSLCCQRGDLRRPWLPMHNFLQGTSALPLFSANHRLFRPTNLDWTAKPLNSTSIRRLPRLSWCILLQIQPQDIPESLRFRSEVRDVPLVDVHSAAYEDNLICLLQILCLSVRKCLGARICRVEEVINTPHEYLLIPGKQPVKGYRPQD